MKKAVLTSFMICLLSIVFLFGMSNIRPVEANGTIYIRADGSVEGTDKIQRDGDIYTFNDNIYDEIVVERSNITIGGAGYTLQGSGGGDGFYWSGINNVTIKNTDIKNFDYGIRLYSSSHNSISGNNITANPWGGIVLGGSSYNSISGNKITANPWIGWWGIGLLESSNYNSISGNNITNSWALGISLWFSSNYNSISGNNITNNGFGIHVYQSSDNKIYHNNFFDNSQQSLVYLPSYANVWDDGCPSGGNYWSDYEEMYPNATEIDDSGLWDTPYVIDEGNQDNYPLMNPWTPTPPSNQPPFANFTYSPIEPRAGEQVTFNASSCYDPDGEIVSYDWDWNGDGDYDAYTTSPTMTFWWMEDGNYQVRLRVTDDRGAVNITSKEITVSKSSTSETIIVLAGFWDYFKFWEWPKRWKDSRDLAQIDGWIRKFEPESKPLDWLKGTKFAWLEKADLIYILNQEIDPVQAPGLTYKIYAFNAIYEERLVHEAWLQPTPRYNHMLKPLIEYAFGSTWDLFISEEAIIALAPNLGIGVATIRMGLKVFSLRNLIERIEQTSYTMGLGYYFIVRAIFPGMDAWSGEVESFVRSSISPNAKEEEKQKILEDTRWYFEELWQKYEGEIYYEPGVTYGLPLELRQQYRSELKELLLSALEKHVDKLPNRRKVKIASPAELRVYDSEGMITGTIDGQEKVEIPNSVYDSETKTATIFLPSNSLKYEVAGTSTGTYGIEITSIENGLIISFTATNIPTLPNATHQFSIDWDALSLGEEGVTVQIDSDGDGVFEHTFTSDGELTESEFVHAELQYLEEFVMNLPGEVFITDDLEEFDAFKKELIDKIDETLEELDENKYTDAVEKLNDMKEEVTDEDKLQPTTESDLCVIIDHIVSSIEALEQE